MCKGRRRVTKRKQKSSLDRLETCVDMSEIGVKLQQARCQKEDNAENTFPSERYFGP